MGSSRLSLKRSLLLSAAVLLGVFSVAASAQGTGDNNAATTTNGNGNGNGNGNNNGNQATSTTDNNNKQTATGKATQSTSATDTGKLSLPALTGTGTNGPLPGLPKLTNAPVIVSYPPPTVPPTRDAPYMQRSNLPDGTVFIAVGAILGAFGVGILVWRAVIACLLHRSVERAATAQAIANDKATFPAPPAAFYNFNDRESSASVVGNAGRGVRRTNRGPTPSATPSQTNLFFSPTAAGNANLAAGRDSRFLPAGFYAAGSSPSPGPGGAGHGHSISLTNLRPDSRGLGANSRNTMREPSPPDSPQFGSRRDVSSSSLNLNRPPSGRAPSAFLDDLLDENPHMFPPQGGMPAPGVGRHQHNNSHSSLGRY